MKSGVYMIRNRISGKGYIGSSKRVAKRLAGHKNALLAGRHDNPHLQFAWDKYGEGAFLFEELEPTSEHVSREQAWLDAFWDTGLLYNIQQIAFLPPIKKPYAVCMKGGHPWTPENTIWRTGGTVRLCKTCNDRTIANGREAHNRKARERRLQNLEEERAHGREHQRKLRSDPEFRERKRQTDRLYNASPAGKDKRRLRDATPAAREKKREACRAYYLRRGKAQRRDPERRAKAAVAQRNYMLNKLTARAVQ